ncbi:methyltransferase [Enterovibrio sp. ZSDZ42]|uniref:tRNA1(Val) (adenine(37)-N6)-methyltransferase n=1 Tax=Enterovibrio gelatinilyticus TaxID=2899819 RepID=A0ABT5R1K2_9GAMM|nr:methyltransferase [Enterovibrio sp. ZSDZ42]MDD1794151.1 methyltransferase [Enterovibrio sp. ZSDZ42]
MNKGFQFKQFSIVDNGCGMAVSTDGVLLGAWADAGEHNAVLDIGTGTGLLSLMMAQRFPHAQITAIDIDQHAVNCARDNSEQSAWQNRINVIHQDIIQWRNGPLFDTIICNPPYFNSGEQASDQRRATARHTDTLSHDSLLKVIKAHLFPHGQAHLILPSVEADQLSAKAHEHDLYCQRLTLVKPTPAKPVSRKLMTLTATKPDKCQENTLVIQEDGAYTVDFVALTRDFYLKM